MTASAVETVLPPIGSVVRPALGPNATLSAQIDLTPTMTQFVVRPDDGVGAFEPGQYFALGVTVDGGLIQRPYSTSSPRDARTELEFLVRLVPGGSFTPMLWALRVGDRIRIGRAKGLFRLRRGDPRTHLFVATGTGLAPFLSMAESLIRDDGASSPRPRGPSAAPPRAIVVHGVSHVDELAFRDRLERLAADRGDLHYLPVVSRPAEAVNAGWSGLTGRLDAQLGAICDRHRLEPAASVAYLCGNPEMIAGVERLLAARGFDRDAIVSEQYWPLA